MVELFEIQAAYYVVASLGVIGTLLTAIVGVRTYMNSNKRAEEAKRKEQETRDRDLETRQAQMFMSIYQQLLTKEFSVAGNMIDDKPWTSFQEFQALWQNMEFRESFNLIGTYYEGIGVLVKQGLLDIRYVALLICGMTLRYWERIRPIVSEARLAMGYSRFLSESEYLYEELVRYLEKHPELQTKAYRTIFESSASSP